MRTVPAETGNGTPIIQCFFYFIINAISFNRIAHNGHLCRKKDTVLSSHKCPINTGIEKMDNI